MAAVDQLLARLSRLDEVVDFIASTPTGTPASVVENAGRAVAVQGLSAFEQFLRERGTEWSSALTQARIPATHLAGGIVPYSDRIVQTLPRRFRDLDDPARSALVDALARTLTSFSNGNLVGHDLFFAWTGSNIQTSDVESIMSLVGYGKGWGELTSAWKELDPRFPGNASAESVMKGFASLRHAAAHQVDGVLDPIAISATTRNVKLAALLVDVAVSHALHVMRQGDQVRSGLGAQLQVRRIIRDGSQWPEYGPSAQRAFRRHRSLTDAVREASGRASSNAEVLIALDGNEIIDWRTAI